MADKKRRTGSNPLDSFLSHIPDYTEKEDNSEQSKTESKPKTESETKTKTKPKTNTKAKPETDSKAITETKPESKTKTEPKAITNTKPKSESKTIAKQEVNTKPETKPQPQQETFANGETFTQAKTFASDIKERAATHSEVQRFEDNRKRQTYWLDHNTIEMISELAERSGRNKYHVVSAGVQMLYEYVFESSEDEEPQ